MDNPALTQNTQDQLRAILIEQAQARGSIPLDTFMQTVLSHPRYGYYAQANRIGASGDFVTAPEISQLFGEITAGFLGHIWSLYGHPKADDIVTFEAGPGHGTLLCDMLRLYSHHQLALGKAERVLLEKSPFLQQKIQDNLAQNGFAQHAETRFITRLDELPAKPIFGIANEFFDALGVCQAIFTAQGWYRHEVVLEENNAFTLAPTVPLTPQEHTHFILPANPKIGDIVEHSALAETTMTKLAQHVAQYGGAILIADYGKINGQGSTIQAVKNHQRHDFFADIGSADLTHLVDFSVLKTIASACNARLVGPVTQARFLGELGIQQRAENLRKPDDPERDRMLIAAAERLTSPAQMGQIFFFFFLIPNGEGLPPVFSTAPPTQNEA